MKTYHTRIAFCLSDQHTIPHGGLGQFAKSFIETFTPLGYKVDIITDKPTTNLDFKKYLESIGAGLEWCPEPKSYSNHTKTFMFEDSYNFEKMASFRDAMMHAFGRNLYDIIICNTLESFPAIYSLNLHKTCQIIYYTHNESMVFLDDRTWKNEFTESFNEVFNALMHVKGITIGTQTERNLIELNHNGILNSEWLPIPMTESSLLEENLNSREGILWIGRWEPRKNPEEFIRVIKETGLPAKIITNTNGAKKFAAELDAIGAKYEMKIGVYGKEKSDFLRSARVAYNPAIRESFGLAFWETLGHMPTFALEGMSWLKNFDSTFYFAESKSAMVNRIKDAYEKYSDPKEWYATCALEYVKHTNLDGIQKWLKCFGSFTPIQSNSDKAKINDYDTICYKDFITELNRKSLAIDDVKSVLTNKGKYNIIYTDENTYLTKDKNFIPKEENNFLESLFV